MSVSSVTDQVEISHQQLTCSYTYVSICLPTILFFRLSSGEICSRTTSMMPLSFPSNLNNSQLPINWNLCSGTYTYSDVVWYQVSWVVYLPFSTAENLLGYFYHHTLKVYILNLNICLSLSKAVYNAVPIKI